MENTMMIPHLAQALTEVATEEHITIYLLVIFVCHLLIAIAPIVDMWDAIYTARKVGERIRSHKVRTTVEKIGEYWRLLLLGVLIDSLGFFFPFYKMPFISMVMTIGIVVIEVLSIFEHIRKRKSRLEKLPDLVEKIIVCANEKDALKLLKEILNADTQKNQKIN